MLSDSDSDAIADSSALLAAVLIKRSDFSADILVVVDGVEWDE